MLWLLGSGRGRGIRGLPGPAIWLGPQCVSGWAGFHAAWGVGVGVGGAPLSPGAPSCPCPVREGAERDWKAGQGSSRLELVAGPSTPHTSLFQTSPNRHSHRCPTPRTAVWKLGGGGLPPGEGLRNVGRPHPPTWSL